MKRQEWDFHRASSSQLCAVKKKHEMHAKCDEHAISAGADVVGHICFDTRDSVDGPRKVANAGDETAVACGV